MFQMEIFSCKFYIHILCHIPLKTHTIKRFRILLFKIFLKHDTEMKSFIIFHF